jgi:hypothetical protein
MIHVQRAHLGALRLALVALAVSLGVALALGSCRASTAYADSTPTFYGADTTKMVNAIQNIWPQGTGNYCGIETAEAATNYADEDEGVAMYFTSTNDQYAVANTNQSSGASQWGYATPTNAYAGETNIAPDFGTDPRSSAYMAWNYTPNNTFYHDYIYRWQFANGTQPSFSTQVQQATTNLGRALETWHEPVQVAINGGLHIVLVSGLFSYNDPATNYPANISSVVYRDPMAAPSVTRFEVDFATWESGNYSTPFGVYSLWSLYYGDKYAVGDGLNTYDPEPSVGIYVPNSNYPVHWYQGFTWIQRDTHYANGSYNPDFAFTSTDQQMSTP